MASIAGYRSPVDIGLGQTPQSTDPETFDELVGVYNAIHLLNQYLDKLRIVAEGGGSGQTPDETMPFNRFYVATAREVIVAGNAVSPTIAPGENGVLPGALTDTYAGPSWSNFTGVALTSGNIGQDIRVGVGPGVLNIPGAVAGNYVWAFSALGTNGAHFGVGTIYPYYPGPITIGGTTSYPVKVGISLVNDYAMIGPFFY